MKKFPYFKQRDTMDCGPTCLLMVAAYYGKNYDLPFLRESSHISREGVSLQGISHAAEKIGFRTMAVKIPFEGNIKEDQIGLLDAPLPCIVHWNQSHAAQSVINGHMSLGMMMGMQYIVAQLNAPLGQFIAFIRAAQDAKLSLERLLEIKNQTPEEAVIADSFENNIPQISFSEEVSSTNDLYLKNVSFRYNALANEVIKNLDITIPAGKVTAIVGASGSGKTTLLKLLLGFYKPTQGKILIGQSDLLSLSPAEWRKHCGAVMQGGYLFSDTIANNIAESDEAPNKTKLLKAVQMANIQSFIESLPTSYNTIIGARGTGISQGQRQRLLIARAVYKNPHFLFLDEATNSLDTNNERVIVENLHQFFQNRTVVVVAHRLSTVKNADKIVVLEHGEIIEEGTHLELVAKRGAYFNLVRNQLELDT